MSGVRCASWVYKSIVDLRRTYELDLVMSADKILANRCMSGAQCLQLSPAVSNDGPKVRSCCKR
jgi:hypothetical protein